MRGEGLITLEEGKDVGIGVQRAVLADEVDGDVLMQAAKRGFGRGGKTEDRVAGQVEGACFPGEERGEEINADEDDCEKERDCGAEQLLFCATRRCEEVCGFVILFIHVRLPILS